MTENKDRYNGKGSYEDWAKEWREEDRYNFRSIEKKWQHIWDEEKAYKVEIDKSKEKFYTGTNSTETYGYNENPVTIRR